MKVHVYSNQDYHTPHERLASYKIRQQLADFSDNDEHVWLLENVRLGEVEERKSDGSIGLLRPCEPDLIVVKQSGIIVVELKHWEGLIEYPTKGEHKANDWYSTRDGVRSTLCSGFQSPVSQVWFNRRSVVAHLEAMKDRFISESARSSEFRRVTSSVLFTHERVSFKHAKPEFWRWTGLCTIDEIKHADRFAHHVAATTTRRRHHINDQRHEIELTLEDIEHIISEWNLTKVTDSEATESEVVKTGIVETIRTRIKALPKSRQKQYQESIPFEKYKGKPLPIRLIGFYRSLLEIEAQRNPTDFTLEERAGRDYYHVKNMSLERALSSDGFTCRASDLPNWNANDDISLGVYILGSKGHRLTGTPLFTLPVEVATIHSNSGDAKRLVRVVNNAQCEVNTEVLTRFSAFKLTEDHELEELLAEISTKASAIEMISEILTRIHESVPSDLQLGDLPQFANDATLSAVLFKPERVYTKYLIEELETIEEKWASIVEAGKVPIDTAWRFLSRPVSDPPSAKWQPRKANVLPINYEQSLAASLAYDESVRVGVISGPPGTGKSQLIVNILAEAHVQEKTVLFASYNNAAVDVVTSKLNDETLKVPLVIGLGSARVSRQTAATLRDKAVIPGLDLAELAERVKKSEAAIRLVNGRLRQLNEEYQMFLANTLKESDLLNTLDELFASSQINQELDILDSEGVSKVANDCTLWMKEIRNHKRLVKDADYFFRRLRLSFAGTVGAGSIFSKERCRADIDHFHKTTLEDSLGKPTLRIIEGVFFHEEREELCSSLSASCTTILELRHVQQQLAGKTESKYLLQWEELEHERVEPSRVMLTSIAKRALSQYGTAWADQLEGNKPIPSKLISGMRTVSTTSLSVKRKVQLDTKFDIVVIDEASQSTISSVIPLLYRGKRVIVIGDEKQLQPVAPMDDAVYYAQLRRYSLIDDSMEPWIEKDASILTLAQHHIRGHSTNYVMLRDHHRSHPQIIAFSNTQFYDNLLRIRTILPEDERPVGVHFIACDGDEYDKVNDAEVATVCRVVRRLLETGYTHEQIGVVTPFRAQKLRIQDNLLRENLRDGVNGSVLVDTAHGFQGNEREAMVYSLVVTAKTRVGTRQWANENNDAAHLINVSVTRARRLLVVVGDPKGASGYTSKLVKWITQYSGTSLQTS